MDVGREAGRDKDPLDFEICICPFTCLAIKVDFVVSNGLNEISPHLAPSGKIFDYTCKKIHKWPPLEKMFQTPILRQQVQ